jgi:hypothetical protein
MYCLAWLGPPSEDSELGMRSIRDLRQRDVALFTEPVWKAILSILDRDYFKRIWIVQELSWATDVYLTCGGVEVHLDRFAKAKDHIVLYQTRIPGVFGSFTLSLVMESKLRLPGPEMISSHKQNPLLHVLIFEGGFEANDPRDHVYAKLNLIPSTAWPSPPDYSKDIVQVFVEAVAKVMKTTHSLEFLRLCDASRLIVSVPRELDKCIPKLLKTEIADQCYAMLPSWIPNWSQIKTRPSQKGFETLYGNVSSLYDCDAEILPQAEIRGSNDLPLLWTHAILYDSIQTCCALQIHAMKNSNAWKRLALRAFRANDPHSKYQFGECSQEAAFWRTLMLDCNGSDTCYRATSIDVSDFTKRVRDGFHVTGREFADLQERCFFVTKTGMFGIGPKFSEIGDFIAIIPGCTVPMILRDSRSIGLYQIIGESCTPKPILMIYLNIC